MNFAVSRVLIWLKILLWLALLLGAGHLAAFWLVNESGLFASFQPSMQQLWSVLLGALFSLALMAVSWVYPLYQHIFALTDWLNALHRGEDTGAHVSTPTLFADQASGELIYRMGVFYQHHRDRLRQANTSRRALEQALLDLPIPLLLIDARGQVLQYNDASEKALPALSRGTLLQRYFVSETLHDTIGSLSTGVLSARADAHHGHRRNGGVIVRHNQPTPRFFRADFVLMDDGQLARQWLVVLQDVTALEHQARDEAEIIANVSHELRTPLTSISGFVENLRDCSLNRRQREAVLDILEQQSTRMMELIEDLLVLSRLDSQNALPGDLADLNELIKRECAALQLEAQSREMPIINLVPDQPLWIVADESEIAQVVRNLLTNALKYAKAERPAVGREQEVRLELTSLSHENPDHAMVLGELSKAREYISIAVVDFGEGIAPHHLPHLTERFYRVDRHRSREMGGTGLGLSIAEGVLRRHGGRLHIQSVPGQGSRFSMVLPLLVE